MKRLSRRRSGMSREIKFRAWDTENKLSDGRFIMWYQDDQCITIGDCYRIGTRDGNSLMQFTGLKDKNGKEIYEGDVIVAESYPWFDNDKPNYRSTVEWIFCGWQEVLHCVNPGKAGISDGVNSGLNDEGYGDDENSHWIVIGNIYENENMLDNNSDK
jgi:uncharacterized phage protein (TIGR01671 family)